MQRLAPRAFLDAAGTAALIAVLLLVLFWFPA